MDWKRVSRIAGVLFLLGIVVVIGLRQPSGNAPKGGEPSGAGASKAPEKTTLREVSRRVAAPDFTLKTIDGETFTLSSVKKQSPIIVNFFSTT